MSDRPLAFSQAFLSLSKSALANLDATAVFGTKIALHWWPENTGANG
jgi:hypothetical protein